jgi:hypothetical protein
VSYARPIGAICRHCDRAFDLSELLVDRDGRCPRCDMLLSPDWTSVLLEEAREAELAEQVFIKSLRRLVGLPGNLVLLPHSVLDNLWDEVGWEQKLAQTPALLDDEIREARLGLERWEHLRPLGQRRAPTARLRHLGQHAGPSGRANPDP